MGEKLAKEYDISYMETSAKTGLNVEFCFKAVSQALLEHTTDLSTPSGQNSLKTLNTLIQLNNHTKQRSVCCLYS